MPSASIVFGQSSYTPTDVITFTVSVDTPMTSECTFNGTVTVPGGAALPCTSTVTVSGIYGPFSAVGYTVTQDENDPSVFHAVPTGS